MKKRNRSVIFDKEKQNILFGKLGIDACLIDMIIGLQGTASDVRPEPLARRELKGRSSTIFPAPCRKAVYGSTKEERLQMNMEIPGKKFTGWTDAICLAITANLKSLDLTETIPENPMKDEKGLLMQMVVPRKNHSTNRRILWFYLVPAFHT